MEQQKQAYIYAIASVIIWTTIASAFKISLRYVDFLQLLFYASIVSIITLFIILLTQNKIKVLKEYSKNEYVSSAILGFLNPFLYYAVLFKAYSLLPAQEAQALNYTWPIMLVLLSIPLLRQKIRLISIFAIIISFIGVLIISTKGDISRFSFSNMEGVALALCSAIIWAVFWIFNIRDKRDAIAKLFLNFIFGFIFILILNLLFSDIRIPDVTGIFGVTYVGLFEMGLTFIIWLKALQLSKTTAHVSNLIYLVPFPSLAVIYFTTGEKILFSTLIGLIFIITGILLQQYDGISKDST